MLVSTEYLHSIYTVSTQYLHSSGVHGVSTVPGVETAASVSCAATAGGEGTYTYTVSSGSSGYDGNSYYVC